MHNKKILVVNCGSSSLKYQLFSMEEGTRLVKGNIERIGQKDCCLIQETEDDKTLNKKIIAKDHKTAFKFVIEQS